MSADRRVPWLLAGLGALLTAALVGEAVYLLVDPGDSLSVLFLVSAGTTAPFLVACVYGGYWLWHSDLPESRYGRIGFWAVGGLVGFLLLNLLTIAVSDGLSVHMILGWIRWAAALGAGTGTVIGIVEARAIHRAVVAERARVRADEAESREELLRYLHNLLRHKVRNAVNAINGHAALLAERGENDGQYLAAIQRQTGDLTQLTREVRTFLEASGSTEDFQPVDLCAVLEAEVARIQNSYGTIDLDLECAGGVAVPGDELLHRAFRNLLIDASIHDPDEVSRVDVSVTATEDSVCVRIADDGAGLREVGRADAFDLNEGGTPERGLGLPLGRILVERYGGEVALLEDGDDGVTLTVTLPRTDRRTQVEPAEPVR